MITSVIFRLAFSLSAYKTYNFLFFQAIEIQEKKEAQGLQSICKRKETCADVHLIRLILHRYRYRPSSSPLDSTTTRVEDKKQGKIAAFQRLTKR
jgi:hypothetical protein